jgi:FtsH-binding integral membrane protein
MNSADYLADTPYAQFGMKAIDAPVDARKQFIKKTYTHLMLAIYAFVALEWLYFSLGWEAHALQFLATTPMGWLIVLGAFMLVSYIANRWALSSTSLGMQYAGLSLYVVAESIIFLPLLALAKMQTVNIESVGNVGVIPAAAVTTLVIFGGLTAFTFLTKKDFSFLGGILTLGGISALAMIVIGAIFGFHIGIWFAWLMVVLASGYILYETSNVLHHYRTDQHVAASLALFASVALLFWYVIQIFMNRD